MTPSTNLDASAFALSTDGACGPISLSSNPRVSSAPHLLLASLDGRGHRRAGSTRNSREGTGEALGHLRFLSSLAKVSIREYMRMYKRVHTSAVFAAGSSAIGTSASSAFAAAATTGVCTCGVMTSTNLEASTFGLRGSGT
jgi:hypothetical protein